MVDLPREYRALWPYLIASAALFFVPLIAMAIAVIAMPDWAELVLPPTLIAEVKSGNTWSIQTSPCGRSWPRSS